MRGRGVLEGGEGEGEGSFIASKERPFRPEPDSYRKQKQPPLQTSESARSLSSETIHANGQCLAGPRGPSCGSVGGGWSMEGEG